MTKCLIISSQPTFLEFYSRVGRPFVEIFLATSIEIVTFLVEKHDFNLAVLDDTMFGRIPGIEPGIAIERHNAGSVFGSQILEDSEIPYIILTNRKTEEIEKQSKENLSKCLFFGPKLNINAIDSILKEKGILP